MGRNDLRFIPATAAGFAAGATHIGLPGAIVRSVLATAANSRLRSNGTEWVVSHCKSLNALVLLAPKRTLG
jgi:hypothetical protein